MTFEFRIVPCIVLLAFATLNTVPALAHHSGAAWDRDHRVTLNGQVTSVAFVNPHVAIHFEVKDQNGKTEEWTAQSGPPQRLTRVGWTSDTLKPGDPITITGICARDGRKIMNVRELIGPKGQTLFEGAD